MPPRYFKNDAPLARRDPRRQLEASLTRLVTNYPPDQVRPGGGLFKGPLSVAYTFLALQPLYPDLIIADEHLGTWSAAYLKRAQDHMSTYPGPTVGSTGITDDILALLALGAASSRDKDMVASLCDYSAEVLSEETENEHLYGRGGYLYLLRLVSAAFPAPSSSSSRSRSPSPAPAPSSTLDDESLATTRRLLADTQADVIDAILDSPRPWKWRGRIYLGALHGLIGTLTQVVLTDPARYAPRLEAELAVLLSYQFEATGNFPATLPPERDRLVQVCHGAPGVVVSLLSLREHFPKLTERIDRAITRARACVRDRGLLTKEPCLCHGISGNALALEQEDFEHFLTYTTGNEMKAMERDNLMEKSESPESLFGGEAGRAWAWAVADLNLPRRILGYNDL